MNPESWSGELGESGEAPSSLHGWWAMQGDLEPRRCIPNKDLRKVYRGI